MIDVEGFYEFTHMPFGRDIPVEYLYKGNDADELIDRLKFAASRQLFAVVTGDSGAGKSTILRRFSGELKGSPYKPLYIADSKLTPRSFYRELLNQLGLEAHFYRENAKSQLHREIRKLKEVYGISPLVIVDEAHLMDRDMLEEVRFLLNCDMDSVSPLTLILSGQTELWDKLRFKSCEAIRQRIDVQCAVNKLDRSQTAEYINAHMAYAERKSDIFLDSAVDDIFKFSGGVCRLINKCCACCLMYGAQNRKTVIEDRTVKLVIECELDSKGGIRP